MSKTAQYLAQEKKGGKWQTVRGFGSAAAAWNVAMCYPPERGRVIFKGQALPRPPESTGVGEHDGRSIVKRQYRIRYQNQNDNNGDDIAAALERYLYDIINDAGTPCINRPKLDLFARENGFWDDKYSRLNNGQVRMNVGNKMRARARKEPDWLPEWPELEIGSPTMH